MHRHYTQLGETALHFAVNQEHEDIVDILLKANADTDLPKKVIHTYLMRSNTVTVHCMECVSLFNKDHKMLAIKVLVTNVRATVFIILAADCVIR